MLARLTIRRGGAALSWLVAMLLLVGGVWQYGYTQALGQVAARAEADLDLAADRLVTELKRYRTAAVLSADHPDLAALHGAGGSAQAHARLLQTVDKTGALTAFYADRGGQVLAVARGSAPPDLLGAAYFDRALQGALGVAHGEDLGFDGRAYVFAAPAFGPDGRVRGVLVVVANIDALEEEWRGSTPAVFFRDADGEVFVSNRSELLGWRMSRAGFAAPDGRQVPVTRILRAGHELWQQKLSAYVPELALHLRRDLPVIGLTGDALVDVSAARRLALVQAAAVMALCLFFGALLFLTAERRRVLSAANARLESRVRARTRDLEDVNSALRHEITEREEAEAALRRAQADLVQAGKLSALGQMSAGISHELNQPLMAIRQFAENGSAFLDRERPEKAGQNLARIADLATRAARIIKNLRAFARNESEPMGKVDLGAVVDQAVELTQSRLRADGVQLSWQRPDHPVWVLGGEVRLAQVFVNLINNAADAMLGQEARDIGLSLTEGQPISLQVRDSGPGIADPEKVFEPFYSTKQVGEGMGLGLSISYGLVQSFGGNIRGSNTAGGAVFTVELEPWQEAPLQGQNSEEAAE
jgi:two-component system C4-dicarboxylate transport sensor histidine kinase DctB